MSVKSLVWGMTIGGGLTLAAFLLVLFYFDPTTTGNVGLSLFFISFTASLLVVLTLVIYFLRRRRIHIKTGGLFTEEDDAALFLLSLRHAGLATFVCVSLLILQSFQVTSWWNILLVLLVPVVVETYTRIKVE